MRRACSGKLPALAGRVVTNQFYRIHPTRAPELALRVYRQATRQTEIEEPGHWYSDLKPRSLRDLAEYRVEFVLCFNERQRDFIWADWPNLSEHIEWLLTATRAEIENWGESAGWGTGC